MIYLDILFLLNWAIDYLILALVRREYFPGVRRRRVAAGACLSAVLYLLWFVGGRRLPAMMRIAAAGLLISLPLLWTFSIRKVALYGRTLLSAVGYTFLMGGGCLAVEHTFAGRQSFMAREGRTLLCSWAIFLLCRCLEKRLRREREGVRNCVYEVEIRRNGHRIFLPGMYDSGNLLVSRWTGTGICVLPLEAAEGLLKEEEKELLSFAVSQKSFPWKQMTETLCGGICQIAYSSVGREEGFLPGIAAERIIVRKDGVVFSDRQGLLGLTKQNILKDSRAVVLLPADIFTVQQQRRKG